MRKLILLVALPILSYTTNAQVGINTTTPNALLDVPASSVASPSNTDGILIPRVDDFPSTNPAAAQDGMMIFVTGNGVPAKGFYYWDNAGTAWVTVAGTDDDWTVVGSDVERKSGDV